MKKEMLRVGDIVILRSGSPYMTVSNIIDEDYVLVQFFTHKKNTELKEYRLKIEALMIFKPLDLMYMSELHNAEPIDRTENQEIFKDKLERIPNWIVKLFN